MAACAFPRFAFVASITLSFALALSSTTAHGQTHMSFVDAFNYVDGTTLNGQGAGWDISGTWTGAWAGDPGFTSEENRISVPESGSISRPFDLKLGQPGNAEVGHQLLFSAEVTEVDPLADHRVGFVFSDSATTPTAEFGLKRIGSAGSFFLRLGQNDYTYTSGLTVNPNTPYTLTGLLEFDVNSGSTERLTLWVNGQYPDYAAWRDSGTATYALQVTGDLGAGRLSLGNNMTITSSLTPGDPILIDDVRVGQQFENTGSTRIDIGAAGQAMQDGFIAWDASSGMINTKTFTSDQLGWTNDSLTITLAGHSVATGMDAFSQNVHGGVAEALRCDGLQADGGLEMTLDGLTLDPFVVKTYHHLAENAPEGTLIQVLLGSITGTQLALIDPTSGNDPLGAEATVIFSADGVSDYTLYYRAVDSNGHYLPDVAVAINGVEIVPEPSTLLLAAVGFLAAIGFVMRRR